MKFQFYALNSTLNNIYIKDGFYCNDLNTLVHIYNMSTSNFKTKMLFSIQNGNKVSLKEYFIITLLLEFF